MPLDRTVCAIVLAAACLGYLGGRNSHQHEGTVPTAVSVASSSRGTSRRLNEGEIDLRQYAQRLWSQEEDGEDGKGKGWKPVHVYYGAKEHLMETVSPEFAARESFSQAGQDLFVLKLLQNKSNGFFIDLASNDAIKLSNTLGLERNHGWTGLCVEPNPRYWYRLAHRQCTVVGSLVGGANNEEVMVRFDNGPLGGIVGSGFDNREANVDEGVQLEKRYTSELRSIFRKFDVPQNPQVIDYLSLDVEGAELLVMENFPFDQYTFSVLTVERPSQQLQALLKENGYTFVKLITDWGETLWAHQSVLRDDIMAEVADANPCWPKTACN